MAATHASSSGARAAAHARAMDENVIATTFSEDSRAYEALARLKELAAEGQIDLHDAGVVERAQDGTLHVRDESGNEDDGLATLTGGTIGLLIGILAGPLGVLLGGAMGLLAGAIVDAEDDEETDSVLEHISRSIGNGETAVLADVGESGPVAVDGVMAALDGQRHALRPQGRRGRDRRGRGGRAQGARQGPQGAAPPASRGDRREGPGEAPRAARAPPAPRASLRALGRSRASQPDHRGARRRPARRRRRDRRGVPRRRRRGAPRQRRQPASTRRGGAHRAGSPGRARRRRPAAHAP